MESQSYIKKFTPKLNINQKLEPVVYDALEVISSFSFIGSQTGFQYHPVAQLDE